MVPRSIRPRRSSPFSLVALLVFSLFVARASAAFTGYLKIPDIDGESKMVDHEDEIDISHFEWSVRRPVSSLEGSTRTRSVAVFDDLVFTKSTDRASPYLFLACATGKNFAEIVFMVRRDSGDAHLDYLQITLTNCQVTSYRVIGGEAGDLAPREEFSLNFESVRILYIEQAEDHSAGNEHEVEYDIIAGA